NGGIELDGVAAERPVAGGGQDQAAGESEAGGDSEWDAYADAAERARIEVRGGGEPDARKAGEVAAVSDHDGVPRQLGLQRREQPVGMHPSVAAVGRVRHRLAQLDHALEVPLAQAG